MTADARPLLRTALRWLRILVALGLVAFLASRAGLASLRPEALSWGWLALGVALVPLSVAIRAFNHALLLNRHERILGPAQAMRLALVGAGIGLILPQAAADLAKAHYGWRAHGHAEDMVVSSVLDRLTSLTAVTALCALGAAVSGQPLLAWVAVAATLVSLAPLAFPAAMPWRLLLRVLAPGADIAPEAVGRAARPPLSLLLLVYSVSALGWAFTYGILYCSLKAVGGAVDLGYGLAVAPISSVARFLPVSVAGIGVGEVTLAALLARGGVPQALAAQTALLSLLLLTFLPGAAGLVVLALGRREEAADQRAA
jgi:uncharacterized membrane protein YbhN (UPF0104 family)